MANTIPTRAQQANRNWRTAARGIAAQQARQAAAQTPMPVPTPAPNPLAGWPQNARQAPAQGARPAIRQGWYMVDSRAAHTALVAVTVLVLLLGILIGGVAARAAKQDSTNGSVAYTAPATGSVRPPTATELETLRVAVTTVGKGWCALEWHATESDYQTVCHQA